MSKHFTTVYLEEALKTELGRARLVSELQEPLHHAELYELMEKSTNTFVKSLLQNLLYEAALQVVKDSPERISLSQTEQKKSTEILPMPPREKLSILKQSSFIEFVTNTLRAEGVTLSVCKTIEEDLVYFYDKEVIDLLVSYDPRRHKRTIEELWDGFDLVNGSELTLQSKKERARKKLLTYCYSLDIVAPSFIKGTIGLVEDEWSHFLLTSGARVGALALVSKNSTISPLTWDLILERSKNSFTDLLLVATDHPNINQQSEATETVVRYMQNSENTAIFETFLEVADLLPKNMSTNVLFETFLKLNKFFTEDEMNNWFRKLAVWSPKTHAVLMPMLKPEQPKKKLAIFTKKK